MADEYMKKMASLLVNYSTQVKEGDAVVIAADASARDMMLEIYREVLRAGGIPMIVPQFEDASYIFYATASDAQLDAVHPLMDDIAKKTDVSIQLLAGTNLKSLSTIDPSRIARRSKAQSYLMDIFMERQAKKELRWVLGPYPSPAYAQEASMSTEAYEEFVYKACLLDADDPVAEWQRLSKVQQVVCDYLEKCSELRYVGVDTDLTMSIKGRTWINCDGDNNMPDGEVFTGPVEDSVNGTIRFTYPAIYHGNEVEDVRLTFKDGKVVEARASKGEAFLNKMLDTDEGARYVGEAAIGTNAGITHFSKNMLFDEKMGGTIHIALGAGYPETGSTNKSSIHWDILKDMKDGGKVYADDELIYEDGTFLIL
ncbi:aminopeptidase [archaeon]|nr:MAG: aminopeptidase [archaeon]